MLFFRILTSLTPLACLLAQAPATTPAPPKPAVPAAAKPKPAAAKPAAKPATAAKPAAAKPAAAKPAAAKPKPAAAVTGDKAKVVLTIGEEKITAAEYDTILLALPDQVRANAASGPGKKQFIDNLVRVKVLAQEGRRRGLDEDPAFKARVALQREELLAAKVYSDITQKSSATQAQVKEYYDAHRGEFETVRASHILIRFKGSPAPVRPGQKEISEEEALAKAQALRKEIAGGGDFAAIARRDSDDAGNGVQGGDLGSFSRGRMVPAFEEVAFKLAIDQVSEPVKTMFGYHLIKVVSRESKTLEQAKAEIDKKVGPDATMKAVEAIQKNTNIVIDPQLLADEKKAPEKKAPEKK